MESVSNVGACDFQWHCGLKADPSRVVRNRELTEHGQTFPVDFAHTAAGVRATKRAGRAATVLVLVLILV